MSACTAALLLISLVWLAEMDSDLIPSCIILQDGTCCKQDMHERMCTVKGAKRCVRMLHLQQAGRRVVGGGVQPDLSLPQPVALGSQAPEDVVRVHPIWRCPHHLQPRALLIATRRLVRPEAGRCEHFNCSRKCPANLWLHRAAAYANQCASMLDTDIGG